MKLIFIYGCRGALQAPPGVFEAKPGDQHILSFYVFQIVADYLKTTNKKPPVYAVTTLKNAGQTNFTQTFLSTQTVNFASS